MGTEYKPEVIVTREWLGDAADTACASLRIETEQHSLVQDKPRMTTDIVVRIRSDDGPGLTFAWYLGGSYRQDETNDVTARDAINVLTRLEAFCTHTRETIIAAIAYHKIFNSQ